MTAILGHTFFLLCRYFQADPANDGTGFPLLCNNGKSMLRANVAGVAVYYSTCGGSADDDCTPSCSDGCTIETVNGYDEAICCDNWKTDSVRIGTVQI